MPRSSKTLEQLKRALAPLAAAYHGTPLLELPHEVLGILADIAVEHDGDMAPAWQAWRDACRVAAKERQS